MNKKMNKKVNSKISNKMDKRDKENDPNSNSNSNSTSRVVKDLTRKEKQDMKNKPGRNSLISSSRGQLSNNQFSPDEFKNRGKSYSKQSSSVMYNLNKKPIVIYDDRLNVDINIDKRKAKVYGDDALDIESPDFINQVGGNTSAYTYSNIIITIHH